MTNLFPVTKRFIDIKHNSSMAYVLKNDTSFYGHHFRQGAIFLVAGYREINLENYLVMYKGSWEGLFLYDDIKVFFDSVQ